MHHDPRRNVLWVARDGAAIAAELQVAEERVERLLESAQAKLARVREARPAPAVDHAVYASWNAMMAEAFLEAAAVLSRPECGTFALRTLERLWAEGMDETGLLRHRVDARGGTCLLDDQVQAASAAIAAYEHTGGAAWLDRARALADLVLRRFADPDAGGYFDILSTPTPSADLLGGRAKPVQDAPTPAANPVAALVLSRLAAITGDDRYAKHAERTVQAFAGSLEELGLFGATGFRAMDLLVNGACRIVVAETTTPGHLSASALATYRPRRVLVHTTGSPMPSLRPPVALVCVGSACASPVTDAESLRKTLETFGRSG
jgi:hypothetical protein